eukprot:UN20988
MDHDLSTLIWAKTNPSFFKDKVVWITGASSGIGRELAIQAAGHGASVILSARRKQVLEDLKKNILTPLAKDAKKIQIVPLDFKRF